MKLFEEEIRVGKDTGNYRIIKRTMYNSGKEEKPKYEPQKETKFLWITLWEPITYESYSYAGGTYDSPYSLDTLQEAKEVIEKYKNETLDGSKTEVIYEEKNDQRVF